MPPVVDNDVLRSCRVHLVIEQSEHCATLNPRQIQAVREPGLSRPQDLCGEIPQGKALREAYCHKVLFLKRK
jgi:hypothetical protein